MRSASISLISAALAAAVLLFLPAASFADFFRYVDEDGVLHITNVPTSGRYSWMMKESTGAAGRAGGHLSLAPRAYDDIIRSASVRHGVDPGLVKAIVKAESDFNPLAVSHAGARGLMQLMPETARLMGVTDVHDPVENIEGGTRYLSILLEKFEKRVPMAVAAYNAGETAVRKYGTVPPYDETREFVKRVLSYYRLYSGSSR